MPSAKGRRVISFCTLSVGVLLLAACAGTATPQPGAGTSGTTVAVTLDSFSVSPAPASAPAGSVTFNVTNAAAADEHEFVVAQTDLAVDQLPVGDDNTVEEDAVSVVDEVEETAPGGSASLTVDLASGHYVLFCNVPGHYSQGMHADFTVNP
jgi:uncharacterized cupredoxin-like copper-binding protein